MENDFLNPQTLQETIQAKVAEGKSYIDAMLEFCDEADMEFEDAAKLMSDNLRQRLRDEYVEQGYLKQEAALPI